MGALNNIYRVFFCNFCVTISIGVIMGSKSIAGIRWDFVFRDFFWYKA